MLVLLDHIRRRLAPGRHADRKDFPGEETGLAGGFKVGLGTGSEAVGLLAADAEFTGYVVASLRHAVVAEPGNDLGLGKRAPMVLSNTVRSRL